MKRLAGIFIFMTAQYMVVAGTAWVWVLGAKISFFRLLCIGMLQAVVVILQLVLFNRKNH